MPEDRVLEGERVVAHAHTFTATGTVVERSGRSNLKVLLDEPPADLPGDMLWFDRHEVERMRDDT